MALIYSNPTNINNYIFLSSPIIENIKSFKKYLIPICLILLSLISYYPSRNYGIVTDFLTWLSRYQAGSYKDVLHCFEYPGLHQFFHLINYSVFKIVGISHWGWYFVLAFLHGVNGYVLYKLQIDWNKRFKLPNQGTYLPLLIAVLFVCFPYNIEAVVWKACLHYLIISCLIFSLLRVLLSYTSNKSLKKWVLLHLLFVLSLFTLELSFAIPLMTFLVLLFIHFTDKGKTSLTKNLSVISVPQIILFIIYFLMTKWSIGSYIGHYGAENHLVFTPELILGNSWRYFFKNLFYVHFWSFKDKEWFYTDLISGSAVIWAMSLLAVALLILFLAKWSKFSITLKTSALNLGLFFLAIAPIVNLYFMWLLGYENDRYGYLGSAFFISAVVYCLSIIKSKAIRIFALCLYSLVTLFFFGKMIKTTMDTGIVQNKLLDSFNFENYQGDIYILAAPDNLKGLYLFRDYTNDGLALREALEFYRNKKVQSEIIDVAQYNQNLPKDSIKFAHVKDNIIHVGFQQTGSWFWRNGIGLSDYETEEIKVEKKPGYYRLTVKNPQPDQLFIYPEAGVWNTFKWPQFGEEPHSTKGSQN